MLERTELDIASEVIYIGTGIGTACAEGAQRTRIACRDELHLAKDGGDARNCTDGGRRRRRKVERLAQITEDCRTSRGELALHAEIVHPWDDSGACGGKDGGASVANVDVQLVGLDLRILGLDGSHSFIPCSEKKNPRPEQEMADIVDMQSPGRVSISEGEGNIQVPGFDYPTTAPSNAASGGIRGNLERSVLNQAYFSAANFSILQNKIRRAVYDKSGEIIDPVGTDDLFMVMRAIYLWYGRNLDEDIPGQIAELDERVSAWCVPKILAEISMYKTYLKDISTLPIPIEQPVNQSSAGTKSLPFKPFF